MSIVTLNNRALRSATTVGTTTGLGNMILIKKLTASSSATLSFVDGSSSVVLDNTYKEYLFTYNNIHPATDNASFTFQASTDSGSNYNTTLTTTLFQAYHSESGSGGLGYNTSNDQGQATGFQVICQGIGMVMMSVVVATYIYLILHLQLLLSILWQGGQIIFIKILQKMKYQQDILIPRVQ